MATWLECMRYNERVGFAWPEEVKATRLSNCSLPLPEGGLQREGRATDSSQRHAMNRQEATSTSYSTGNPTRYKAKYFHSQSGEELVAHSATGVT